MFQLNSRSYIVDFTVFVLENKNHLLLLPGSVLPTHPHTVRQVCLLSSNASSAVWGLWKELKFFLRVSHTSKYSGYTKTEEVREREEKNEREYTVNLISWMSLCFHIPSHAGKRYTASSSTSPSTPTHTLTLLFLWL